MNGSVLCIGTFDGLHLGHRHLLKRVVDIAQEKGLNSVVITYGDHPAFVLKKHAMPKMLCPAEIKKTEMLGLGIQHVELMRFDEKLAETSAHDFLCNLLVPRWNPKVIVLGYDSHFGRGKEGNIAFLESYTEKLQIELDIVRPLMHRGKPISSSYIRTLLETARLDEANYLLGRPYKLVGSVSRGKSLGRTLGFPTANLLLENSHQLIPAEGIYLSKVTIPSGTFFGLTNIGRAPTVKLDATLEIETYIIDFNAEIYDSPMQVELLKYMREERMFESIQTLKEAMQIDLEAAYSILDNYR